MCMLSLLSGCYVFDFRGTTCRYFEKTSITLNKHSIPSLYLLSPCTSTKSHSQTSIIFTLQGLRGNLFRTGNVKCTHSLLQARLSVPLPSFRSYYLTLQFAAASSSKSSLGSKYNLPAMLPDFSTVPTDGVTHLQLREAAWSEITSLKSLPWNWVRGMCARYPPGSHPCKWALLNCKILAYLFRSSVLMTTLLTFLRVNCSHSPRVPLKCLPFIKISLVSSTMWNQQSLTYRRLLFEYRIVYREISCCKDTALNTDSLFHRNSSYQNH